jgi:hypothetical protein
MKLAMLFCLFYSAALYADAPAWMVKSGPEKVALLELYSSESCSSCPPADQWVSRLKVASGLWKRFVPVVFHVTYWNHLGWKDGFSSDRMTARQYELAHHWQAGNVYTPAMAVDGREWRDWRNSGPEGISAGPGEESIVLTLERNAKGGFLARADGLWVGRKYVLHFVELGMKLETQVTGGENSGRRLQHDFLVQRWESRRLEAKGNAVEIPASGAGKPAAVAAWLEREGSPVPLQAVGGDLP